VWEFHSLVQTNDETVLNQYRQQDAWNARVKGCNDEMTIVGELHNLIYVYTKDRCV